jgi:hypothetical protein
MKTFVYVADHISQHGAFCLQDINLLLLLHQRVHDHCILRDTLVFIFMDFSGHRKD